MLFVSHLLQKLVICEEIQTTLNDCMEYVYCVKTSNFNICTNFPPGAWQAKLTNIFQINFVRKFPRPFEWSLPTFIILILSECSLAWF